MDNTSTAAVTGQGTNSISWGTFGSPDGRLPNTLTFTGTLFSGVAPDEIFDLGTVTWFNGLASGTFPGTGNFIFGVTLDLSVGPVATDTSSQIDIRATFFTSDANPSAEQNADCITFSQFAGTACAFEQRPLQLRLFGRIVGDPQLELVSFALAPGQEENGFLLVPEPAPIWLLALGLGILGLGRIRRALVPSILRR